MELTPLEKLNKRLEEIGGCGDGNCQVHRRGGMHTNGGCRCFKHDGIKASRVVHAYKQFVKDITAQPLPSQEDYDYLEAAWRN